MKSKVNPAFLHANSTSHTWAFSAVAELIDNAYDPDVKARKLRIDQRLIEDKVCLTFEDDGDGMTPETLHNMMSFGFSDKEQFANARHQAVGRYGNGFKSGAMRLGKDALVFTRHKDTISVGLLSQTYLHNINAQTVLVPIVTWDRPHHRIRSDQAASLKAILEHSIFKTEDDLLRELADIEKSGTTIIIYNLKARSDKLLELDFQSDPFDIRDPKTILKDSEDSSVAIDKKPDHMASLKKYCKILYLKPKLKIWIRGRRLRPLCIENYITKKKEDKYKPSWANDCGTDVIAVVEANQLTPKHTKQGFVDDAKYNSFLQAISKKLRDYWKSKKETADDMSEELNAPYFYIQCDNCDKWRRIIDGGETDDIPEKWFCRLNDDPAHNRCDIEEEPEKEDLTGEEKKNKQLSKQGSSGFQSRSENRLDSDDQTLRTQIRESLVNDMDRSQVDKESTENTTESKKAAETKRRPSLPENPDITPVFNPHMPDTRNNSVLDERLVTPGTSNRKPGKKVNRKRNANENMTSMNLETPGTSNGKPGKKVNRKRNANENMTSMNLEYFLDWSSISLPAASTHHNEGSNNEIDDDNALPKRQRLSSKSKCLRSNITNQATSQDEQEEEQQKEQSSTLNHFCDVETQTKEMARICSRECMQTEEELRKNIESEKRRASDAERSLKEVMSNMNMEEANRKRSLSERKMEDAKTQTKEVIRMCNRECMQMDEELRTKIAREEKRAVDAERKFNEATQNALLAEKKVVDFADTKVKEAEKKLKETEKRIEEVNRKEREADRKWKLACDRLREAETKANSLEKRLVTFRRNVYTFLRINECTGNSIGGEEEVEEIVSEIIRL